jgi:hypothetical protein
LRIGYLVDGGVSAFYSLFGLFYVAMGALMASTIPNMPNAPQGPNAPPPEFFFWFFAAFGALFGFVGIVLSFLNFFTAYALKKRRYRGVCLVTAALTCLFIPYGTIIGIFTFIVLGRPSVKMLFDSSTAVQSM